jgi:hypothetical protein
MDKALVKPNPTERKRCAAPRRDGQPCQAPAGFCFFHDPGLATPRDAARRRGGQNSARIVQLRGLVPRRLIDVYDILENVLGEVRAGKLNPPQASAIASVARAMIAASRLGELEERVRELEQQREERNESGKTGRTARGALGA